MTDLSILIPARNEPFLKNTIDDILVSIEADTEIIIALDGQWPVEPLEEHERVTILYLPESIGQRAAINAACRVAQGQYVMKLDAHCSVGPGFDRILLEDMQPNWTQVPKMYNLHVFDWVCAKCGSRWYQGPTPTYCMLNGTAKNPDCDSTEFYQDFKWKAKRSPETTAMRFDSDLRFGYWSGYKKRQKGQLVETMSILGACWMISRERYWELKICDEAHGSWGQQGTEVACATWLSGGKLICNKRTWFAHLFRTQGGDFGFPYPLSGHQIDRAREYSKDLWFNNKHPKQIHPLSWLVEKFWPVEGWEQKDLDAIKKKPFKRNLTKGIVYYTDNRLDEEISSRIQQQLLQAAGDIPIYSVSLQPIDFGKNITLDLERGILTMFKQILAGLEACESDIVFLCEHDVLYHASHFDFIPTCTEIFYYNQNVWKYDWQTGRCLFYYVNQTSGLCAYRSLLLEHYRQRVALVEKNGFTRRMGFEPGTHRRKERIDDYGHEVWESKWPNVDIRHDKNLTPSRWSQEQFRNKKYCRGWTEADEVPGWENIKWH